MGTMTVTTLEPVTTLDVDLDAEVPCSDETHDHPADVLVACTCPPCGRMVAPLCWEWWDWLNEHRDRIEHRPCHTVIPPESIRIVEVLRCRTN
jgi:hypothetical protein